MTNFKLCIPWKSYCNHLFSYFICSSSYHGWNSIELPDWRRLRTCPSPCKLIYHKNVETPNNGNQNHALYTFIRFVVDVVPMVPWMASPESLMVQPFTPSVSEPTASQTDSKLAKTSCPLLVVEITLVSRAAFRPLLGLAAVQQPLVFNTTPSPALVPDIRPT